MKILITAGSTQTPIDKVRGITNIFKGKTGSNIAYHFAKQEGNQVTLITSRPELIDIKLKDELAMPNLKILRYDTFDELLDLMKKEIAGGTYNLVIHSAAVSDYKVEEVLEENGDGALVSVNKDGKIPSGKALYLKLVPTEKIVDKIKSEWGFSGQLVMFKLQVDIRDTELISIAKKSMIRPKADFIIANCLEWAREYAYMIDKNGVAIKIDRDAIGKEIERKIS